MMFTATWPVSIRRLAADFLQNPVEVRAGEADELRAPGPAMDAGEGKWGGGGFGGKGGGQQGGGVCSRC